MTRVHEPSLEVAAKQDGEQWVLRSPAPGWFLPTPQLTMVARGDVIGELEVLGRRTRLVAPDVMGLASTTPELLLARKVGFGDPLVVLSTVAPVAGTRAAAAEAGQVAVGLVFRAPTSGRFYGRATPEKPPFVAVGDELGQGATICLLEVMKTFHRVTYGGPGLPERARVREILIADGADVTAGDPLLALE
jgi:acetyl-CoA carboxylase biotin carboxyl carrier protein